MKQMSPLGKGKTSHFPKQILLLRVAFGELPCNFGQFGSANGWDRVPQLLHDAKGCGTWLFSISSYLTVIISTVYFKYFCNIQRQVPTVV